jgi:hypothetical protein
VSAGAAAIALGVLLGIAAGYPLALGVAWLSRRFLLPAIERALHPCTWKGHAWWVPGGILGNEHCSRCGKLKSAWKAEQ